MMYNLINLILGLSIMLSCANKTKSDITSEVQVSKNKILIVSTSEMEVNGKRNGTFLSEIAVPFALLEDEGYELDIVSPMGGAIPIYYKFDTTELIQKALDSKYYNQQIQNSLKPNEVLAKDYEVVILPGGYGQFWDIHNNKEINNLIAKVYENGGAIGALGHGTSSLVNVDLSNGEPLVKDVTMTCFPSWFEKEVMFEADYGKLLPFDMEQALKEKGADLKPVDKATRSNGQIVDSKNRVITASSATGGEFIAAEILKLLED